MMVVMYTFIVPAHNEARLLPCTLESIRLSAGTLGEPYELIVVDDASTDATARIAREHGARVVQVTHRQIAKVRNSGAAEARGDVLIFVDADTTISPVVLRGVRQALQAGAVGGGAAVAFDGRLPFYGRVLAPIFVFCYRHVGLAAGCFVYATRQAFDKVSGFDETLFAGEEVEFSQAMRRHGRFVILREPVITSGRKLRTYSFPEMCRILLGFTLRGPRMLRSRERLGLWYDPRRDDPYTP